MSSSSPVKPLVVPIQTAAEMLSCHRSYVWKMISKGELESTGIGRRRVIVASIEAFIERNRRPARNNRR
jgi:excisionase family DNA binding protein